MVLGSQLNALGQEVNMNPNVKPEFTAKLDKMYYNSTDTAYLTILGPPSTPINLSVIDSSSSQQKIGTIVKLAPNGTGTFSFNLTSFSAGIYYAMVGQGYDRVKIGFGVGILPAESGGILYFDLPQYDYKPSAIIQIQGFVQPDSILQMNLIDPYGTSENSTQVTSDGSGKFWMEIGVPYNAVNGTWELSATSGVNHRTVDIVIHFSNSTPSRSVYGKLPPPIPNFITQEMLSPLHQFKSGIAAKDVKCRQDLQLIINAEDRSPACVKLDTAYMLIKRGWAASESAYPGGNTQFALDTNSTIIPAHLPRSSGVRIPYYEPSRVINYIGFDGLYNETFPYRGTQNDYVLKPGSTGVITFKLEAMASEQQGQSYPIPLPKSLNLTNYAIFYHEITSLEDLSKYPGVTFDDGSYGHFRACSTGPAGGGTCIGGQFGGTNPIEAFVTDHPGVDVLFEPPSEVLPLGMNTTSQVVTMTITADSNASRGTYLVELPAIGVDSFLLTVGDQPYHE